MESLEVLTVRDVARMLQVHRETVYRMVDRGQLRAHRLGSSLRFRREDVLAALVPQEAKP